MSRPGTVFTASTKTRFFPEHLECRFIDVPYPGEPVEVGQTNIFVRTALYYYNLIAAFDLLLEPTDITDTFTLEDSLAIEEFQRTRGLTVTGVIDEDTWTLLYYQYGGRSSGTFSPTARLEGSVPQPSQTLVPGSRGVAVEQLQIWINALSAYYCDWCAQDVTGIYDEATESNVFILQTLLDLPLTGEVDQQPPGTSSRRLMKKRWPKTTMGRKPTATCWMSPTSTAPFP